MSVVWIFDWAFQLKTINSTTEEQRCGLELVVPPVECLLLNQFAEDAILYGHQPLEGAQLGDLNMCWHKVPYEKHFLADGLTVPVSRTTIWSACLMVDSRWAMISTVCPFLASSTSSAFRTWRGWVVLNEVEAISHFIWVQVLKKGTNQVFTGGIQCTCGLVQYQNARFLKGRNCQN